MDCQGFPLRVDMVQDLAVTILQERDGNDAMELGFTGKHWISQSLNRHPHLATSSVRRSRSSVL